MGYEKISKSDFVSEFDKSNKKGKPTKKFIEFLESMISNYQTQFNYDSVKDKNSCFKDVKKQVLSKWNLCSSVEDEKSNPFWFFITMTQNEINFSWQSYIKTRKQLERGHKKHYIKKDEFKEELLKSRKRGQMTEKLGQIFVLLVDNIQKPFVYKNEADRKDCKADVLENLTRTWNQCDLEREDSNPFSYFTKIVENSLYFGWNNLKRNQKNVLSIDSFMSGSQNELD